MRSTFAGAAIALALLGSALRAQPPHPPSDPQTAPADPQLPKGIMPTLGRPTESGDKTPAFDFDAYFSGKWTFEWVAPESALGPGGPIAGTTTFRHIDGSFYQADTDAKGPSGPIRLREHIAYHKDNRTIVRHITDSRGFAYLSMAPVGSDLGGIFYMYFESEPFTYKGKTIRLKENWRLVSVLNYRVSMTMSTDGGRFTNYGNPWWQKQMPGVTGK
jgi:hypothetical protein